MSNFNTTRFMQVARWDMTINKAFYRNFAIVTLAGIAGITILGFFMRWLMNKTMGTMGAEDYEVYGTVFIFSQFVGIMQVLYAGCINHPLRNKQGRITELTLPATNLEKYLWHALIMVVGGYLVCLVSIFISDAINLLFSSLVYGGVGIRSLTAEYFRELFFIKPEGQLTEFSPFIFSDGPYHQSLTAMFSSFALFIFTFGTSMATIAIFALGNSLKYKYNIILTYVAMSILQFVISLVFIMYTICFGEDGFPGHLSPTETFDLINILMFTYGIFALILSAALWWLSYKYYKRAQVTSRWNR